MGQACRAAAVAVTACLHAPGPSGTAPVPGVGGHSLQLHSSSSSVEAGLGHIALHARAPVLALALHCTCPKQAQAGKLAGGRQAAHAPWRPPPPACAAAWRPRCQTGPASIAALRQADGTRGVDDGGASQAEPVTLPRPCETTPTQAKHTPGMQTVLQPEPPSG